jgi:rubrerythrin
MPIVFNADEVYALGIEIEKNGKAFYEAAAKRSRDAEIKKFLTGLAEWENSHINLFEDLRNELSGKETDENAFDPDNEAHRYLKAAADSHIFRKSIDVSAIVSGCKTVADVLNVAVRFEKDSVVLYNTMMGLVPAGLGKDKIERLVDEELKHVAMLHEKLEML